ncbi:serum response factor-binding protein 1 [Silurus meridionalis]|nr:serum response factor-binding protein 1 [Silurus meridionalis]
MPAALNLSNEVVKMRAEVKRVKVLIIRKLTRQIFALKKKKGTEADLQRNQRRAARLLEEIRELKALAPDRVTKTALQSDISFEKVCQNKDSSLSERATARIATHPEFSKKIQSIKNAVEAFKAERTSSEKRAKKKSRDSGQQERESDLDSDEEEGSEEKEYDEDDDDDDDDDGSQQKVQEADDKKVKEPTKQNKDPVTSKESSSDITPAEVVRMRKEVKKLRVLIIRNLTQQITNLKKLKTDESELKGNVECVARLQKEVQVLRTLLPDQVTARAIEGGIDMEKVFQDPEYSAVERAIARIVTHERFVKKLQDVRQAVEQEKIKATKPGEENKGVNAMMKVDDSDSEVEEEDEKEEEEEGGTSDDFDGDEDKKVQERQPILKLIPRSDTGKPPENINLAPAKEKSKAVDLEKVARGPAIPKSSPKPAVKAVQNLPSKSKPPAPPLRQVSRPDTKKPENRKEKEESDLSDSDEEKEYFDDSTEERFHKQSSYSEQSDDDDFFLGKVSKLRKKKSDTAPRKEKTNDPKEARENKACETPQFKVESVFCSSLSKSGISSQKGKHSGLEPPRFSNQKRSQGDEKPSWPKNQGPGKGFKSQPPGSRESSKPKGPGGYNTGKPAFERKKAGTHFQQALHPSWEASRKRKEQQAQITAFQGKKIKFDD